MSPDDLSEEDTDYDGPVAVLARSNGVCDISGDAVYLLFVLEGKEGSHGKESSSQPKTEEEARKSLEEFVRANIPGGDRLTLQVRKGIPADEITNFAQAEGIDLIVMATHGRTGVRHMMMGSVAERVLRLCNVPVLTVKPHPLRETYIRREDVETDLHLR